MRRHVTAIVAGLLIAAVLLLYRVTYTVRWQEQALVVTFGQISRQVEAPGLHGRWPWQDVVTFDGRIKVLQQQLTQTQTSDQTNLVVSAYVNWRVADARTFYARFRKGSRSSSVEVVTEAEKTLRGWIADAGNIFAEYPLEALVTLEAGQSKLAELEKGADGQGGMLRRLREKAAASGGYGVQILDVGIWRLGVPDDVTAKIFERIRQDRQAVATALEAEGTSAAESLKGEARSQATIIKAEAEAKAKAIMGEGDAAAAAYYQRFLEHPELAQFLRRLETLRKTLSERTTIVLDSQTAPYGLLTQGPRLGESGASGGQEGGAAGAGRTPAGAGGTSGGGN